MTGNINYKHALNYINTFQFHGFRLGLERMEEILSAIGHPEDLFPCIHVAGSNGKGSVCATLSSILHASGLKPGLYTSPHLYSLTERFRCCEKDISEEELAEIIFQIKGLVDSGYELSYFEFTTTIAFLWLKKMRPDIVILETGLGGRLDATNVVSPVISVITNISLEHQSYLGDTIEKIAKEKAGIIKKGSRVISGVLNKGAREVIENKAREMGCSIFELGRDFFCASRPDGTLSYHGKNLQVDGIEPGLKGRYQEDNLALALAVCEHLTGLGWRINEKHIKKGVKRVVWPCRLETFQGSCHVLIDGAHNKEGVSGLKAFLRSFCGDKESTLLWACSDEGGDKDIASMLFFITPLFKKIIITQPPGPRKPVTIKQWQTLSGMEKMDFEKDWRQALALALKICGKDDLLCVSGSLYLAGSVREELIKMDFKRYDETY